jgi:hypothetical protein
MAVEQLLKLLMWFTVGPTDKGLTTSGNDRRISGGHSCWYARASS